MSGINEQPSARHNASSGLDSMSCGSSMRRGSKVMSRGGQEAGQENASAPHHQRAWVDRVADVLARGCGHTYVGRCGSALAHVAVCGFKLTAAGAGLPRA